MRNRPGIKYSQWTDLKASNAIGLAHLVSEMVLLVCGILMSTSISWLAWLVGQAMIALVFLHAFIMLHEAGHATLFRSRGLNWIAGHWAGSLALIPFSAWRRIHARHHRYTGWQDLDATTASLVPRELRRWERRLIDFAWASWLPLFSILYRVQNYWNLPRLVNFLSRADDKKRIALNSVFLLVIYALSIAIFGFFQMIKIFGLALFLSLMVQDLLILSQHTHIPQHHSEGKSVTPFPALEQVQFTRSLKLPDWLSVILMHNDAHGLHHMYPNVPGYRLNAILCPIENRIGWWPWLLAVKRLSGSDFLFSNRNQTGMRL